MKTPARVASVWIISVIAILTVAWAAEAGLANARQAAMTLAERLALTKSDPGQDLASTLATDAGEEALEQAFDADADDGDVLLHAALQPDTSDLKGIRERGFVRFAVAPDPLLIAYDGERAIGAAIDIGHELEKHLKAIRTTKGTPTVVVPVPTPRAAIAERLSEGIVDFTAFRTSEDSDELSFTKPLFTDVTDVLIHGPGVEIESLEDLTKIPVYIQDGGRYAAPLQQLNADREAAGKEPIQIRYVDGRLDDYDLFEMVEIGLIPATVMADYKAELWQQIYESAVVRTDLPLGKPQDIGWTVRTSNPELLAALDGFADKVAKGTLLGNILFKRYFTSANWIQNLDGDEPRGRIAAVEPVIRKFSEQFDFDHELVLAQAYQESKLDQNARSHVGAVGVMQVMPSTARDQVVGIPDISGLENNVHAGVKYLRYLRDQWFDDDAIDPLDQTLLSFAAYNAGPGGVSKARKRAAEMGLDPNVWFENVEIAMSRVVSREPVIYVRNIFKYYVSYRLMRELEAERLEAKAQLEDVAKDAADLSVEEKVEALDESTMVSETSTAQTEEQIGQSNEGSALE